MSISRRPQLSARPNSSSVMCWVNCQEEGSLLNPFELPADAVLVAATGLVDFFIADANAQQAEIEINTPQINAIKARMADRQRQQLDPLFDAGAIGFGSDGLVVIRDRAAVPAE